MRADEIVAMGLVQTPEGRHIFPRMAVKENLAMGAYGRRDKQGINEDYDRVYELFPVLKERQGQPGGTLREIHSQGTTILLVEQNAQMALQFADRGYVLESGEIILADDAKSLLGNEEVRKAYLGEE
jgi:branched-chain amino acid transport system ATP-binding protein